MVFLFYFFLEKLLNANEVILKLDATKYIQKTKTNQ